MIVEVLKSEQFVFFFGSLEWLHAHTPEDSHCMCFGVPCLIKIFEWTERKKFELHKEGLNLVPDLFNYLPLLSLSQMVHVTLPKFITATCDLGF